MELFGAEVHLQPLVPFSDPQYFVHAAAALGSQPNKLFTNQVRALGAAQVLLSLLSASARYSVSAATAATTDSTATVLPASTNTAFTTITATGLVMICCYTTYHYCYYLPPPVLELPY